MTVGKVWRPNRADIGLAIMVGAFGVVDSLSLDDNNLLGDRRAAAAVVTGLGGLLLILWRHRPIAVAAGCAVVHVVAYAPIHLLVSSYGAGAYTRSSRRALAFGGFLVAAEFATVPWLPNRSPVQALIWGFVYLTALIVGLRARQHEAVVARHAASLVREREHAVERVRAEERTRMAREMHDVVAHRVTLMVVEAGALEVSAAAGPDRVAEAAGRIRVTGRAALEELRHIIEALEFAEDDARLAPQPGVTEIPALVDEARGAGLEVSLSLECSPEQVPTAVGRTAYRVVQEALTNVFRHTGGAPTRVSMRCRDDVALVSVVNTPPRPGSVPERARMPGAGTGLIGLRERVSVLDGTIFAEPDDDGGFELTVTLPIEGAKGEPSDD